MVISPHQVLQGIRKPVYNYRVKVLFSFKNPGTHYDVSAKILDNLAAQP